MVINCIDRNDQVTDRIDRNDHYSHRPHRSSAASTATRYNAALSDSSVLSAIDVALWPHSNTQLALETGSIFQKENFKGISVPRKLLWNSINSYTPPALLLILSRYAPALSLSLSLFLSL
jgi:hypothetical protein